VQWIDHFGVGVLDENPDPSEQEIRYGLAGNLCRCTGYQNIVKAVQSAAKKLAAAKQATPAQPAAAEGAAEAAAEAAAETAAAQPVTA